MPGGGEGGAIDITGDLQLAVPSMGGAYGPGTVEHVSVTAPGGDFFSPGGAGFGMDVHDFSGIGSYADSFMLPSGNIMNIGDFKAPEKKEEKKTLTPEKQKERQPFRDWVKARRRGERPLRERWQDPTERKKILRNAGLGILSLVSPQFRMARSLHRFGKGMRQNPQGIMGALGNMFLSQKLGPNADLFRSGLALSRGAPAGGVFKNLLVGRGLKAGIGQLAPSLFRKAYQEQGMRGVYMMNQLLNTVMPKVQRRITGKLGGGGG
jgi:hypothetical protein